MAYETRGALGVFDPYKTKAPQAKGGGVALPPIPGFPGTGTSTAKPMTTVVNGVAGSYVNGKFVPQGQEATSTTAAAGVPGVPGALTNTAQKDAGVVDMQKKYDEQLSAIKGKAGTTDPNQQFLIDQYKGRLDTDQTQRMMDRAAGNVRDVQGAQRNILDRNSSVRGGGSGAGQVQQSDAAVRAAAKSGSDIQLADQARRDALVLGGGSIMNAPGQRELAYDSMASSLTNANPAIQAANLGLAQQGLGIQQYSAQNQAQLAQQQMQQQSQMAQLQAWLQMMQTYQGMI